jgi:glycosyltransferase involved in cell wall biosynthesis
MARLLHITPNEYPSIEAEHATKQIWKELAKDVEEYHVIGRSQDQHFHSEREGKLYLHRVPKLKGNKSFLFTSFLMIHYIRKYKIDSMLAQCAILGGIAGVFYSKICRIPIMVEIHGVDYFNFLDGKRVIDKIISGILRWVYANAERVRALNLYMEQMLKERNVKANIVIVQNRADLTLFSPPKANYDFDNEIKIVCVGNFVKLKGHQLLIEAVKQLAKIYPVKLTLVGGGILLEEYKKSTEGLDNFIFYERIQQQQLVELLREADVYAHTSYKEAVPRAIIEAMAMGLPIVTSDAGMIRGLIQDEINGLIFSSGNEDELERQLRRLIENKNLRENLGRQAYKDAKEYYEWSKNFDCYRKVLNDMYTEYKKDRTK